MLVLLWEVAKAAKERAQRWCQPERQWYEGKSCRHHNMSKRMAGRARRVWGAEGTLSSRE